MEVNSSCIFHYDIKAGGEIVSLWEGWCTMYIEEKKRLVGAS